MLIKRINIIQEFFICLLLFGITFSNALVETSFGFVAFIFLVKLFFIKPSFKEKIKKLNTPLNIFIGTLFLIILISYLRSDFPRDSFKGLLRIIKYSLLYFSLIEFYYNEPKRIKRCFWAIIAISGFTYFNGIFQGVFGFDLIRHKTFDKLDYLQRLSSSFVHPNDFGTYIISLIPLSLLFLLPKLSKKKKAVLFTVCLLGLYCLIRTSSRGAWLGIIIGLIVFFYFYNKKLTLLVPIIIVLVISVFPNGLTRINSLFSVEKNSSWERTKLWEGTWNMIKVHPITGFGVNTFSDYFPAYKPKDYPDLRYAHNSYLQMWSEIGIIGLLVFLGIIFSTAGAVFRKMKLKLKTGFEGLMLLGLISGWIAFLVQAALDTNLYSLVLITKFWFLTALTISLNKILENKIEESKLK